MRARGADELAAVFLGLGSNLGDRKGNIREALDRLSHHPGIRVSRVSSLYETAPVGYMDQPDFLNAVALVETDLEPSELMQVVLSVENDMGRVRNHHWGPRVIDVDVLLYDDAVIDAPGITIPHPRMMERAFVIAPLAEIAQDLVLPDGRTAGEALRSINDQPVRRLTEAV